MKHASPPFLTKAWPLAVGCRVALLGAITFALVASGAAAQAAPRRVGVVPFTGPGAKAVQKAVTKAIAAHKFKIIDLDDGPAADPGPGEDQAARTVAARSKLVGVLSGVVVTKR